MRYIRTVHCGESVFRFFFSENLQSCNVLQKNQNGFFASEVNHLNFDIVIKVFIYSTASCLVFVCQGFFYYSNEAYGQFAFLIFYIFIVWRFTQANCILFLSLKTYLFSDYKFVSLIYLILRISKPVNILVFLVSKKYIFQIPINDKYKARQHINHLDLFFILLICDTLQ